MTPGTPTIPQLQEFAKDLNRYDRRLDDLDKALSHDQYNPRYLTTLKELLGKLQSHDPQAPVLRNKIQWLISYMTRQRVQAAVGLPVNVSETDQMSMKGLNRDTLQKLKDLRLILFNKMKERKDQGLDLMDGFVSFTQYLSAQDYEVLEALYLSISASSDGLSQFLNDDEQLIARAFNYLGQQGNQKVQQIRHRDQQRWRQMMANWDNNRIPATGLNPQGGTVVVNYEQLRRSREQEAMTRMPPQNSGAASHPQAASAQYSNFNGGNPQQSSMPQGYNPMAQPQAPLAPNGHQSGQSHPYTGPHGTPKHSSMPPQYPQHPAAGSQGGYHQNGLANSRPQMLPPVPFENFAVPDPGSQSGQLGDISDLFPFEVPFEVAANPVSQDQVTEVAHSETYIPAPKSQSQAPQEIEVDNGEGNIIKVVPKGKLYRSDMAMEMLFKKHAIEAVYKLGEGGMGIAYIAYNHNLRRWSCIKGIKPDLASNDDPDTLKDNLDRFVREARQTNEAAKDLAGIAQVNGLYEIAGNLFFDTELIEGQSSYTIASESVASALGLIDHDRLVVLKKEIKERKKELVDLKDELVELIDEDKEDEYEDEERVKKEIEKREKEIEKREQEIKAIYKKFENIKNAFQALGDMVSLGRTRMPEAPLHALLDFYVSIAERRQDTQFIKRLATIRRHLKAPSSQEELHLQDIDKNPELVAALAGFYRTIQSYPVLHEAPHYQDPHEKEQRAQQNKKKAPAAPFFAWKAASLKDYIGFESMHEGFSAEHNAPLTGTNASKMFKAIREVCGSELPFAEMRQLWRYYEIAMFRTIRGLARKGVLHRDLKPDNMIINADGAEVLYRLVNKLFDVSGKHSDPSERKSAFKRVFEDAEKFLKKKIESEKEDGKTINLVYTIDLGLVKSAGRKKDLHRRMSGFGDNNAPADGITLAGDILGTPHFIPPNTMVYNPGDAQETDYTWADFSAAQLTLFEIFYGQAVGKYTGDKPSVIQTLSASGQAVQAADRARQYCDKPGQKVGVVEVPKILFGNYAKLLYTFKEAGLEEAGLIDINFADIEEDSDFWDTLTEDDHEYLKILKKRYKKGYVPENEFKDFSGLVHVIKGTQEQDPDKETFKVALTRIDATPGLVAELEKVDPEYLQLVREATYMGENTEMYPGVDYDPIIENLLGHIEPEKANKIPQWMWALIALVLTSALGTGGFYVNEKYQKEEIQRKAKELKEEKLKEKMKKIADIEARIAAISASGVNLLDAKYNSAFYQNLIKDIQELRELKKGELSEEELGDLEKKELFFSFLKNTKIYSEKTDAYFRLDKKMQKEEKSKRELIDSQASLLRALKYFFEKGYESDNSNSPIRIAPDSVIAEATKDRVDIKLYARKAAKIKNRKVFLNTYADLSLRTIRKNNGSHFKMVESSLDPIFSHSEYAFSQYYVGKMIATIVLMEEKILTMSDAEKSLHREALRVNLDYLMSVYSKCFQLNSEVSEENKIKVAVALGNCFESIVKFSLMNDFPLRR